MGNGPSMKEVNLSLLDKYDTFGLNAAFKFYEKNNWYPTYHGCFDRVNTVKHEKAFKDFVERSPQVKKFFYLEQISRDKRVQKITMIPFMKSEKFNSKVSDFDDFNDNGNSGVNACSVAVCLGYKKIILLGVDCDYSYFEECKKNPDGTLVVENTESLNKNYWIDDYLQSGERVNPPQIEKYHIPAWNRFAKKAEDAGIEIVNCSRISKLECFRNSSLEEEIVINN